MGKRNLIFASKYFVENYIYKTNIISLIVLILGYCSMFSAIVYKQITLKEFHPNFIPILIFFILWAFIVPCILYFIIHSVKGKITFKQAYKIILYALTVPLIRNMFLYLSQSERRTIVEDKTTLIASCISMLFFLLIIHISVAYDRNIKMFKFWIRSILIFFIVAFLDFVIVNISCGIPLETLTGMGYRLFIPIFMLLFYI